MNKGLAALLIIVAVALVGFGVVALTGGEEDTANDTDPTTDTTQSQPQTVPETNGDEADDQEDEDEQTVDQVVDIDMSDHSFSVEEIRAAPGETVAVNLTNNQGIHDFHIDELGVASRMLSAGQSDRLVFTIPEDAAGETYDFYCSVSNHRQLGMEGQLIISE